MMDRDKVHEDVKDYYGKVLQSSKDLKTSVCTSGKKKMCHSLSEAIASVHRDIADRSYGCGFVIPEVIEGMHILDLGCGAGLDCYALSKLIGENGHVTGVDMTDEQLSVARSYIDYHKEKFGYKTSNVTFVKGYLENMSEAGIKQNHHDIIISNCVVNLVADKTAVLREAYQTLKVGGEMYFSDMYADSLLGDEIRKNKMLWGEGFSGALYWKDLYRIAQEVGFSPPRLVSASTFQVYSQEIRDILGDAKFVSAEYRLFKLPEVRDTSCSVSYNGSIPEHEEEWKFDVLNTFKRGEPTNVNAELATILKTSRFADHFTFGPDDRDIMVDPIKYADGDTTLTTAASGSACCTPEPACCPGSNK